MALLADAMGVVGGLGLYRRVPPQIQMQHVSGGGEIDADAAGHLRQQEHAFAVEALDHLVAFAARHAAVHEQLGSVELSSVML